MIGAKSRNMHRSKRAEKIHGTGGMDKAIVSASWNVRAGCAPSISIAAGERNSKTRSMKMLKLAPRSSVTSLSPMRDCRRLRSRRHQSRYRVHQRQCPHQYYRELLESPETRLARPLYQCRAVLSVSVYR